MLRRVFCLAFVLTAWKFSISEGQAYCPHHECDVHKCLPQQWVCDGETDCHDGSDEHDCAPLECEEDVDFQCTNKIQCVPLRWLCDGDADCHDGSDEVNCANSTCAEDHMSCGPGKGCIHNSYVCDGHIDCPGGLDEKLSTCKNRTCLNDEFQCRNDHRCISERWRCDGDADCDDRSDEDKCSEPSCDDQQFQCTMNLTQCIPLQWHCDGSYDCYDKTDELNCNEEQNQHCDADEVFCPVSHECIHASWVCDSDVDCGDGSDESNCGAPTCRSADEFQCRKIGNCIPGHWKCDGQIQCEDRSDEEGCISRTPCDPHTQFDCSRNVSKEPNCIPVEKVCDHRNDCGASEDESPELCGRNHNRTDLCRVNNGGCLHDCVNTPLSSYCTCRTGYRLASDNQMCEDIDECLIHGSCSQMCNNTKGGFKCSCREGYELDPLNHQTCMATGEPSLIFANRHELREFHLRNGNYRLLRNNLHNTRSLDFDFRSGYLFWSDASNYTISLLQKRSSGETVTEVLVSDGVKSVDGIAFDWIHKNLYWTDIGNSRIDVLSLEQGSRGRWRTTVISGLDGPRAVVVDPRRDRYVMYWTECGKSPSIRSAYLDGSNVQPIVRAGSDILWPNSLTLDYETNILYWTDMKLHFIASINVGSDGPKVRKLVLTSFTFLRHPFSVTVFEDNLYWTDWQSESILKVNKFTASALNVTRVLTRLNMPMDIRVYHQLRQPDGDNVCANRCSHICLPNYSFAKFSCMCPNSDAFHTYKLSSDRTTCLVTDSTDAPRHNSSESVTKMPLYSDTSFHDHTESFMKLPSEQHQQSADNTQGSGKTLGLALGITFAVVAAIILFGIVVIKKYKKKNIKSMNFDNPVYRKRREDEFSLEKNEYHPGCDVPDGINDIAEPLRLSCDNYLMEEK